MKILFITAWYPTGENPVSGIFIREHAKAVSLSGDEVIVVYAERSKKWIRGIYKVSDSTEEGIRTLRISYFPSPFRPMNYIFYLWSTLRISKRLMKGGFKPDVIHAHIFSAGVPAVLFGKLYGIPIVITEHWHGFPQKKLKLTEKIMAKFAMNRAYWILPVSQSLQRGIEAYGIKGRFQIVPNVVDPFLFHPIQKDPKQGHKKKILFVGSLNEIKGLHILFRALAKLTEMKDQWELNILGEGPARQEYEDLAATLGLTDRVTFHGRKPKSEVAEFMRRADLLVLPSLWENLPCVLIEAMASGLPMIATLTGGIPEIFHEELGTLVPPGDTDRLSSALCRIMGSLDQFDRGKIAQRALSYRPEPVGKLIHSIYQDCIER